MFIYLFNSVFKTSAEDQTQDFIYARKDCTTDSSLTVLHLHSMCVLTCEHRRILVQDSLRSRCSPPTVLGSRALAASVLWTPGLPVHRLLGRSSLHLGATVVKTFTLLCPAFTEVLLIWRQALLMNVHQALTHRVSYPALRLRFRSVFLPILEPLKCTL